MIRPKHHHTILSFPPPWSQVSFSARGGRFTGERNGDDVYAGFIHRLARAFTGGRGGGLDGRLCYDDDGECNEQTNKQTNGERTPGLKYSHAVEKKNAVMRGRMMVCPPQWKQLPHSSSSPSSFFFSSSHTLWLTHTYHVGGTLQYLQWRVFNDIFVIQNEQFYDSRWGVGRQ